MKNLLLPFTLVILFFSFFLNISCHKDDDLPTRKIDILAYSNTPDVPFKVNFGGISLTSKNSWKKEGVLLNDDIGIYTCLSCKDKNVLLTVEFYEKGKLITKEEGNSYICNSITRYKSEDNR